MKWEEIDDYNLSDDELFKVIKDKCRSRSKTNLWCGLAAIVIVIAWMVAIAIRNGGFSGMLHTQIFSYVLLAVLVCAMGWLVYDNYRFLRLVDDLNTPEQLLYWYKKKNKSDRLLYFVSMVTLICGQIDTAVYYGRDDVSFLVISLIVGIPVIVFIMIYWYWGLKNDTFKYYRRDVEIIERLQELAEKK